MSAFVPSPSVSVNSSWDGSELHVMLCVCASNIDYSGTGMREISFSSFKMSSFGYRAVG